jgi:[acyl-carrier-protein] S-malonyltransferase
MPVATRWFVKLPAKWEPVGSPIAQGVERFVEVGPGKVLCGLMRQIDRSKATANVEDEISLQKALERLATAV